MDFSEVKQCNQSSNYEQCPLKNTLVVNTFYPRRSGPTCQMESTDGGSTTTTRVQSGEKLKKK